MSSIFPSGGLAQAYTALSRFVGVEQNTNRSQGNFTSQVKKAGEGFDVGSELNARARSTADSEGFKEYFVSESTSMDPNSPRGSYVNIVV
ncbi:MAG TPA: hypothetical protein VGF14_00860 [Alphaproteobacteria bacterium]